MIADTCLDLFRNLEPIAGLIVGVLFPLVVCGVVWLVRECWG